MKTLPAAPASVALALALALALAAPARAQLPMPSPDQPDLPVDAALKAQVIDSLVAALNARYVFPETGRAAGQSLRARLARREYDRIKGAKEFADSLTSHLRADGRDLHFHVFYYHQELPPMEPGQQEPPPEQRARILEQSRRLNFGFEKVERLLGNVGYLELRAFDGAPEAGPVAEAAMSFLANTDALIVDLRRNGGGDPNMVVLMLSYLYGPGERIHINDFYWRDGDRTEQFWTLPTVPGPRHAGKDLYVLTSRHTGSAAEEFAYDIQNLKRGTLVGERTAGAANPGGFERLHPHFACFISNGRAINPITRTNWEGVGVKPDMAVAAAEALETAHVAALEGLIAREANPERKTMLGRALEQVKRGPAAPAETARPAGGKRSTRSGD